MALKSASSIQKSKRGTMHGPEMGRPTEKEKRGNFFKCEFSFPLSPFQHRLVYWQSSMAGVGARIDVFSSRQKTAYSALGTALLSSLIALYFASPHTSEHVRGVLLLPGLLPTLFLTFTAPFLTFHVIASTKESFLAKGFAGRDLLKASSEKIPESLGLPTSILYCMLMFCFIPFRYSYGFSRGREAEGLINIDGGWNGDMTGRAGFPHHEVSSGD